MCACLLSSAILILMDGLSPYIFSRFSKVKSFKNPLKGFSHSSIESKAEKRKKIWFGYHDCYRYTDTYISIIVITVYIFSEVMTTKYWKG